MLHQRTFTTYSENKKEIDTKLKKSYIQLGSKKDIHLIVFIIFHYICGCKVVHDLVG